MARHRSNRALHWSHLASSVAEKCFFSCEPRKKKTGYWRGGGWVVDRRYVLECSTTKVIHIWWEDGHAIRLLLGRKINNKDMKTVLWEFLRR